MHRREVCLGADALYVFKGGGFGEAVGMNKGLTASVPAPLLQWNFKHRDNLNTSLPVDDQQHSGEMT